MVREFEEILEDVGSYGKYQKLIVIFVVIPTSFFIAFSVSTIIFETVVPEKYWCDPPGIEATNLTREEWWNLTLPRTDEGDYEKCSYIPLEVRNGAILESNSNETKECLRWEHDRTFFEETVATSMGWLCDKEIYSTHILSVNMAGNAVGTLLLPILADKFTGRRVMFFISCAIHLTFNLLILVFPYYGVYLAMRFLGGLSFQTNFQMPYTIGLELTCPDKRALVSFFSFVAWTFGMCSSALVGWLIPHWWYLIIISSSSSFLFLGYWSFLPESPRWLLSKGRLQESVDILLKVAKVNGKNHISRKSLERDLVSLTKEEGEEHVSLKEVFKFPKVLFNALLVTSLSMATFIVYGCTLVNVKILPNNYFLSFFTISLSELPSNAIGYLSVHYLGRRFTSINVSLLSMGFCFLATFFTEERVSLLIVVCLIKICVTQGIYVVYVITSEVFPTPVRTTGMGEVIVAGMIGLIFSPYIVASSASGSMEYWIMIGLCGASLILSLPLPETIGLPLPQTFHEADIIGDKRPHRRWVHYWNQHKYHSLPAKPPSAEPDSASNNNPDKTKYSSCE